VLSPASRERTVDPKTSKEVSRQALNRFTFGLNQMDDVATRADLGVLRKLWRADFESTDTSGTRASALEVTQKLAKLAQLRLDFVARKHKVDVPKWKGLFTGNAVDERRRRLGAARVDEAEWTGRPDAAFWGTLGSEPAFGPHLQQVAFEAAGRTGAASAHGASAATGPSSGSKRAGEGAGASSNSGGGASKKARPEAAALAAARAAERERYSRELTAAQPMREPAAPPPAAPGTSPSLAARIGAAASAAASAAAAAFRGT
jgi:hypothetical protein